MAINIKKASPEEIQRGLDLLDRENVRKDKIKKGLIKGEVKWKDLTDEQKDKARLANKRRNLRISLTVKKALAAGITVTEQEIDKELSQ